MAVAFSAMTVGQMSSMMPDYGKARDSTNRIFHIHDSEPEIDPTSTLGYKSVRYVDCVIVAARGPPSSSSTTACSALMIHLTVHAND